MYVDGPIRSRRHGAFCIGLVLVFGALACDSSTPTQPRTPRSWYVMPDSTGDAPTIQAAVDSAKAGDEVVLGPGTYTWSSQGGELPAMIRLKAGVSLRGEEGAEVTILDGELLGRLVLCQDVGKEVRIEGITMVRGSANAGGGIENSNGGAIYALGDSEPTIVGCVFRENRTGGGNVLSKFGGAISCDIAIIEDCVFVDNFAFDIGLGGAIGCGAARINNCEFKGNFASGDGGGVGGAIYADGARITNCLFEENSAGAFIEGCGGAIAGVASIDSCIFLNNRASATAGVGYGGALCSRFGESAITNSIFIGNVVRGGSAARGGAIFIKGGIIENCTFLANASEGPNGVGGIAMEGNTIVRASILAFTQGPTCSGENATWICNNLFGNSGGRHDLRY